MAQMPFTPCTTDPCTDVTVSILQTVFGPVIRSLTLGQDPSGVDPSMNVIASMMSYFNSGVLTVAALIVSFVTVMGVINTANDGEAFGKNWSSLWTPVRIVSGAAMLLPTGAGYSFIQLVVMTLSLWGVGFANGTFKIGVENGIIAGSLQNVSQQIGVGAGATANKDFPLYNMRELAAGYMNSAYCAKTMNSVYGSGIVSGLVAPTIGLKAGGAPDRSATVAGVKTTYTYEFKDRNTFPLAGGNAICGTLNLYEYKNVPPTPTAALGSAGLLSAVFDDSARDANNLAISTLRDAILASKLTAIKGMIGNIDTWVKSWPTDINKDWSGVSVSQFNTIVDTAQAAMLSDLKARMASDDTLKKLMDRFTTDITKDGWAMAGGYYQRLGGIREELRKIYAESPGEVTQPALGWLPDDAKGNLVRQSTIMSSTIARKAIDNSGYTSKSITDTANVASIIPTDFDDVDIDQMGSRGNKVMNSFVGNLIESITNTAIGADGNVDAMARIKATGDILAIANSQLHTISNLLKKTSGAVSAGAGALSGIPIIGGVSKVVDGVIKIVEALIIEPIMSIVPWLDALAFYFGVFLPSLPYTIFIMAVVGWLLAVLQTVFAAPLWAVMHMSPDRTFVGSQTQGYLMLLSLFMRPVLIIAALFAAMLLANPIVLYVSKAFWAMRTANVSSAESVGFLVQFYTWKNWLIMYGMLLLPVVYMIFGLTNALPDAILTWIGAGIKPLGETQATSEMRSGMERQGVGARTSSASNQNKPGSQQQLSGEGGSTKDGSGGENRLLSDNIGGVSSGAAKDYVPPDQNQNSSKRSVAPVEIGSAIGATTADSAGTNAETAIVSDSGAVAGADPDPAPGTGTGTATGEGTAIQTQTPSSNLAQKNDSETAYVPENTDASLVHDTAPVVSPDRPIFVGEDGDSIFEESAKNTGIGELQNTDKANAAGSDSGDAGIVSA